MSERLHITVKLDDAGMRQRLDITGKILRLLRQAIKSDTPNEELIVRVMEVAEHVPPLTT